MDRERWGDELARVYSYGLALASQHEASGATYYFLPDGHGSTRLLADSSGAVVNAFAYDACTNHYRVQHHTTNCLPVLRRTVGPAPRHVLPPRQILQPRHRQILDDGYT